ncbi:uncharacterized protein BO97DRAFT_266866 [Aspergillus homomorphus CBS 101889]|uniref:Uncharacterized protein n=1 Tax=Aspergillus homomorphus (strain CBS 101889) TaxID=1450537 RepID=A0A395HHW5_ASPHC|nr:hypothetical protein BO97DRAFT_266866 [Aspergillus homomorphus CBS 101889]RAL07089.1 hypothetical protein BO97DRAFT_266866 [Aspergillus homomorphus CBS 101889]
MIRSKPTRITLGDEDLRFHLQRLLARHTRLAEWHQHDQYLNGSDFDENEDDAFLESDSDLFSPPDFSPSRSVCGSNPDGFPEDSSSTPRGGGRGNNTGSRPAFPSEESTGSSSASASSSLDADQPVIVLSSSLSLLELGGSAADQGTADTRSEFQPSTESGDGSSSQSRIAAQGLYSPPGHYVIRESSLSHCITPARAGSDEVSCEDTGSHSLECDSQISLPSVSHTSLHQPELSSPAFRSVSSETRTMIPISSLLEEQTMRHSDSSQIHTPPGAVHEARGSSSEDKIHPEMAPVAQSEQSAEPTTLEANKSNAITDGVKKKSRALIRSTHDRLWRATMLNLQVIRQLPSLNRSLASSIPGVHPKW